MDDLDRMLEIVAHASTLHALARDECRRLEQRHQARLRKARQRALAPTTLPANDDAPQLPLRSA